MTVQHTATALYVDWIGRDDGLDAKTMAAKTDLRQIDSYAKLEMGGEQPAIRAIAEAIWAHNSTETIRFFREVEDEKRAVTKGLPDKELERLALKAESGPRQSLRVVTEVRRRDPNVREYVLRQAGGVCGQCKSTASFKRAQDNTPYLEVHHRIPLVEGGDDTAGNAVALCPNCHREAYFGENWGDYRP